MEKTWVNLGFITIWGHKKGPQEAESGEIARCVLSISFCGDPLSQIKTSISELQKLYYPCEIKTDMNCGEEGGWWVKEW